MNNEHNQIKQAIDDISIIKRTIEKAKIEFGNLASLFLVYGITVFVSNLLRYIILISGMLNGMSYRVLNYTIFAQTAVILILFVFYYKKRNKTKLSNNDYTLQLYDIWGFTLFIPPLIKFIQSIYELFYIGSLIPSATADYIKIIGFAVALYVTGVIIKSPLTKLLSVLTLAGYVITFYINSSNIHHVDVVNVGNVINQINMDFEFVIVIGYILLGIYLFIRKGGESRGAD